jgi:hypothetical protein
MNFTNYIGFASVEEKMRIQRLPGRAGRES